MIWPDYLVVCTMDTDAKKVPAVRHQVTPRTLFFFDKGVQLPACCMPAKTVMPVNLLQTGKQTGSVTVAVLFFVV